MANAVVVGGGFGGLTTAKNLAKSKNIHVTLIDRRNYHLFQPLLYQVATAGLSPAEIAVPIRAEMSDFENVNVVLGNVESIDIPSKNVLLSGGAKINYDYLVLACGAKHSYFGKNEWEDRAPGLKTLEQATEIRRRVLVAYEMAENETDKDRQRTLLTFVVVGGGPTGVELAGAIAEISRNTLSKDFRHIDPSNTRVLLIEAGPRVLAGFDPGLSKKAARDLEMMGVQIWTNSRVTGITKEGVALGSEFVAAETVLWAAGVQASSLGKRLQTPLDRSGRVEVDTKLRPLGLDNIFVIGDMAATPAGDGKILPGLAPVALQQGKFVARQIQNILKGRPLEDFHYFDKGQMATIGRRRAVLQFKSIKIGGFLAWAAWLLIHIYYLANFKNKIFVFFQWTWSYITFRRGARLILHKDWKSDGAGG